MPHILVIDDDPIIRLIIKRSLEVSGYTVTAVDNGRDGIIQAQQIQPTVIICDWIMSGLTGLEVCRQVKADPQLADIYFILITSRSHLSDRIQGFAEGADDFLSKPLDLTELKARMRAAVKFHQLNQDLLAQKQLLEDEFAKAADYVKSILPPPMVAPIAIETCFIPSLQLGGDCFDYYWLDPDYLLIYLLDVSGHGLAATLPSITVHHALRSQILPGVSFYRPERVLQSLNETFQISEANSKYFTIWYGLYDRRKCTLTYASAGHPPAVLISPVPASGEIAVQRLSTPGLPIGMMPDVMFSADRCTIPPGSSLYIFSDGIYEILTADRQQYWGLDAFVEYLTHHPHQTPDDLALAVRSLCDQDSFSDDLSILRVQF